MIPARTTRRAGAISVVAALLLPGLSASQAGAVPVPPSHRPPVSSSTGHYSNGRRDRSEKEGAVDRAYGMLPLSFERNEGQAPRNVLFLARGDGYTLFLTRGGLTMVMRGAAHAPKPRPRATALSLRFVRPLALHRVVATHQLPGRINYFLGKNPSDWHTGVPTYRTVTYRNVYPGVDMVVYGQGGRLEYNWVVRPGADPSRLLLRLIGARSTSSSGRSLAFGTPLGSLMVHPPSAFQPTPGQSRSVAVRQRVTKAGLLSMTLGRFNRHRLLVIDPALQYSTYLGGTGSDVGQSIAVDSQGDAYIAGYTSSSNFPVSTTVQSSSGGSTDAFVSEINSTGTTLVFSTYFGGSLNDYATGVALDGAGDIGVTGYTTSTDFPVYPDPGALQTSYGGGTYDAFALKLAPSGSQLAYSTYVGGSGSDSANGIAMDSSGNTFVVGQTKSTDLATVYPLSQQTVTTAYGFGFISEINGAGTALSFSTYLGGSAKNDATSVAISGGNLVVGGWTTSTDFPTLTPYQSSLAGTQNAFVAALTPAASGNGYVLAYSTFLGGNGTDTLTGVASDAAGNAYVAGQTTSSNFPTLNAYQTHLGGASSSFVSKLSSSGDLKYSTYLGGSASPQSLSVAVDENGLAYIAGSTSSTQLPTLRPIQGSLAGETDGFLSVLNADGGSLAFSTYLGGSGFDAANGIALDPVGNIYLTGQTTSSDFPTLNPMHPSNAGSNDAFVAKLDPNVMSSLFITAPAEETYGTPFQFTVTADTALGAVVPTYNGTIHFASTDAQASLPADYTFTASDAGVRTFTATLQTGASPTVTATDTVAPAINGSAAIGLTLGPPVNVTAVPSGNIGSIDLSWAPPEGTGGGSLTGYTVSCTPACPNPVQVSGSTTLVNISGLTPGTGYAFTVTAANGALTSPPSASAAATAPISPSASPPTTPGVPQNLSATAANASAVLSWNPPKSNGGRAVLSYTITCSPGCGSQTAWGGSTSTTISSLTNGTPYTFQIAATNLVGTSSSSSASNSVTPATVPDPPTGVTATPAGDGVVQVTWTAPASDGGSPVSSYTVACQPACPGGTTGLTASGTSTVVSGLLDGTAYTFTLTAANGIGTSAESAPSNSVTPSPSAASLTVSISAGGPLSPGSTVNVTVKALDSTGQSATGYVGTVHLTSTDPNAVLPADYQFTPGDLGVRVFSVTLWAPGDETVTAADTGSGTLAGTSQTVSIAVPVSPGFNLMTAPLQNGVTGASQLAASMNSPSQLGAGAIDQIDLPDNGDWDAFVPGASPNLPITSTEGIAVDDTQQTSGLWVPPGQPYQAAQQVQLQAGWNLVAAPYPYTGLTASQIGTESQSCDPQEVAVWQDSEYLTWTPGGSDLSIPAYRAIWLLCGSSGSWTPGS